MANSGSQTPALQSAPDDSSAETKVLEPAVEILRPHLRNPNEANQVVAQMATLELFRGPLPPAQHFRGYEEVVPGSAREILEMAKTEQTHRHKMQTFEMLYPYLGWFAGFVGFLCSLAGAVFLAMNNHEPVAGGMLGVPCLGVIGWFIRSRLSQSEPVPARPTNDRRPAKQPPKRRR